MDSNRLWQVETHVVQLELPEEGLLLDCGRYLPEVQVAYESYGELNSDADNALFVCHALTGDAHVAGYHGDDPSTRGWWDDMVGPGKGIDTNYYFVICANILGGCKGTTGPASINPATGKPYGSSFPPITVGDIVKVNVLLLRQLGVDKLAAVIGASFGGMQAFEMTLAYPDMVGSCISIASAASLSTQALAFDAVARRAITSDPAWHGGDYYDKGDGRGPVDGLALARKIGHITYLSSNIMTTKFGREKRRSSGSEADDYAAFVSDFEVGRYLDYQGQKFVNRFDANSYLCITKALDEYDLAALHGGGELEKAFDRLRAKVMVVALTSDWLFPPEQSRRLANALVRSGKDVSYAELQAPHGHDAFLVDVNNLAGLIRAFLPWVGEGKEKKGLGEVVVSGAQRSEEYQRICSMIVPGSTVLDLGCGDGALLSYLGQLCDVRGLGVDIDIENILKVIYKGHNVFQNDVDGGLEMIPDGMYDYAILSETLQVVKKPRLVLREMLRVANEGIVSFPNFGKLSHRLYLGVTGRMPKGKAIPHEWYDTPNIHPFTVRDFEDLCRAENIVIEEMLSITDNAFDRFLTGCGRVNAGASRVLARVRRPA